MLRSLLTIGALALALTLLPACKSLYYSAWESMGYEKRDLLVDQVEDTRSQQEDTKEQFASALDQFKATFDFEGGDLEEAYDQLKRSYDRCESEAGALRGDIAEIKEIAGDLFTEWDGEIEQQTNAEYQKVMKDQRNQTQASYDQMVAAMDAAADKMDPVLQAFNERVLFLKSSLNAQAIASLESNADELVVGVETLIDEMNASIAEADAFIASLSSES